MAVPARFLNAEILAIERPDRSVGLGGDQDSLTVVLQGPIPCNRQTKIERNFGTAMTRFDTNGPDEFVDAAFYMDLPETPTDIRVGDLIRWRRTRDSNGKPSKGPEITGSEIRRLDVNDGIIGAKRKNMRFLTRGGDGSGA